MKIFDVKITGDEFNEERMNIIKYFLRENYASPFLSWDSSDNVFMNFIPDHIDDYRDEKKRERKLITFDEFVNIFNINTKPKIEYEYYYEVDEKDKSIVRKKMEL